MAAPPQGHHINDMIAKVNTPARHSFARCKPIQNTLKSQVSICGQEVTATHAPRPASSRSPPRETSARLETRILLRLLVGIADMTRDRSASEAGSSRRTGVATDVVDIWIW